MSLVLHRIPGIGSPRGFILFSRCQFSAFTRAFWLQANVRAWTGRNGINANHFSGDVTAATSFLLKSVTFLLEWFVMMIEVPKRSFSPPAHRAGRGEAEAVGGAQPRRAGGRMSEIKEIKNK